MFHHNMYAFFGISSSPIKPLDRFNPNGYYAISQLKLYLTTFSSMKDSHY